VNGNLTISGSYALTVNGALSVGAGKILNLSAGTHDGDGRHHGGSGTIAGSRRRDCPSRGKCHLGNILGQRKLPGAERERDEQLVRSERSNDNNLSITTGSDTVTLAGALVANGTLTISLSNALDLAGYSLTMSGVTFPIRGAPASRNRDDHRLSRRAGSRNRRILRRARFSRASTRETATPI